MTESQNTLIAQLGKDQDHDYGYKIHFRNNTNYIVWDNQVGDEIVHMEIHTITDKDWIENQLTEEDKTALLEDDLLIDIDVPLNKIEYEVREKDTNKMASKPSTNRLIQMTASGEIRGEGGQLIEPDHPEIPLRKAGLI